MLASKSALQARPAQSARPIAPAVPRPNIHLGQQSAAIATAALLLLSSPLPGLAREEGASKISAPSSPPAVENKAPPAAGPTSITFTMVSPSVAEKLRARDENLAWKCNGQSMYDCDGSLASDAEKKWEDVRSSFKK